MAPSWVGDSLGASGRPILSRWKVAMRLRRLVPALCALALAGCGDTVVVREQRPPPPPPAPTFTWIYYGNGSVFFCEQQNRWYWRDANGWWSDEHPPAGWALGQPVRLSNTAEHPESFAGEYLSLPMRIGKYLVLETESRRVIVLHLMRAGRLVAQRAPVDGPGKAAVAGSGKGPLRLPKHVSARLVFDDSSELRLVEHGTEKRARLWLAEDRDEVPESETGTSVFGGNYEYAFDENNTLGASYLNFQADSLPERDGLSVYNLRAYVAPIRRLPDLSFAAEFAREENGDLLGSTAWFAQAAYQLSKTAWTPKLSYRYAFFEGDDPGTANSEAFDPLLPGFSDWGSWWQGEIAGEYFLSNSNLISHQLRVHVTPSESLSAGLIGYSFLADQPASFGSTSDKIATELDAYADWQVNGNFLISFVVAVANPQEAVEEAVGRTENFTYGMVYVTYTY